MTAPLASLLDVHHLIEVAGYPLLFLLVMGESSGIPIPGETALITAAVLASQGKLRIEVVIALAAGAAIVGDNIGYLIGRRGGRWLLERPGRFQSQRKRVLDIGQPFFERHGPKAVYFGRFLLGLRVWASWLAGATRMRWRSFLFWNASGGISWAVAVGLIAYFLGASAKNALEAFGLYGLAAALIAIGSALVLHRRHQRRIAAAADRSSEAEAPRDTDAPSDPVGPAGAKRSPENETPRDAEAPPDTESPQVTETPPDRRRAAEEAARQLDRGESRPR